MLGIKQCGFVLAATAIALQVALGTALGQPSAVDVTKRLVGTWRLLAVNDEKGQPTRGPHPTGLIFYDSFGNMAVQIQPDRERAKFKLGQATPDQAKDALTGYTAYFGTYSIDQGTNIIRHHRKGNINAGEMEDFVRRFEFAEGDKLILRPVENNNQLIWERVK